MSLTVTQNINKFHITAVQNNQVVKLQPIINTVSPDFIETDPVFQASEASLFVTGDKDKLDGIEAEAEVNVQSDWNQINPLDDSYIKNKPTIPTVLTNHSELTLDDGTNPHGTTKSDIGLGSVDNTSDINKPISTATQNALDSKIDKVTTSGVERVYTINTDGSQGTKATSDFEDVLEFANFASFPTTGESGKIYFALDINSAYYWSGSAYAQIGGSGDSIAYFFQGGMSMPDIGTWYANNVGFAINGAVTFGTGAVPSGTFATIGSLVIPSGYILEKIIFGEYYTPIGLSHDLEIAVLRGEYSVDQLNDSLFNYETLVQQTLSIGYLTISPKYFKELTIASHSAKQRSALQVFMRQKTNNSKSSYSMTFIFKKSMI